MRLAGVAGTHGKSTTSGWLVHLLWSAGRDPSAFVGALLPPELGGGIAATARWGTGDVFVVEADEYAGNFDPYQPDVAVLLNAEWDHPDVFPDQASVLDAFERWIRGCGGGKERPVLVANAGDGGVSGVLHRLVDWPGRVAAFALAPSDGRPDGIEDMQRQIHHRYAGVVTKSDVVVGRVFGSASGATVLELSPAPGMPPRRVTLQLPGRHMAENALAVATAALRLGVPLDDVVRGLETFRGVGRRLELKGEVRGVVVLDDYGHHPTAIAATMEATRQRYRGRRLWAVYEPLTYHRTAAMLDAFADVLARADRVAVADIWAGRDPDTSITSARALAEAVRTRGGAYAVAPGSVESTADHLAGEVRPGDIVLVMGGGRSYVIADRLVALLREHEAGKGSPHG